MTDAGPLDAASANSRQGGASFPLSLRLRRMLWQLTWLLLVRWTPPPLRAWRAALLRLFGGEIGAGANVYASARIWYPANLVLGAGATLGPRVRCYNQGRITIGERAIVSQDASLCASSHDHRDPHFQLILRPIVIGADAWIAAEAFVGPGAVIGEGAVVGARAAAFGTLEPWAVHLGNPAVRVGSRRRVAA